MGRWGGWVRGTPGLVLAIAALGATGEARAQEYHVDLEAENVVRFISRAAIEEFEGVTDRIDGYVMLATERLGVGSGAGSTSFYFEVDLASLDTGIGLRNRHMRDNYLEVREHPYAVLQGELGSIEAMDGGFRVAAVGELSIHGVTRRVSVPCEVSEAGSGYRAVCEWEVLLSDHDIEIPKVMFLKLANEIRLVLDFHLTPAG